MPDMETNLYILFAAVFQTLTTATALTVVFLGAHIRNMNNRLKDDLEALHIFWGSAPNQSRVDQSDRALFDQLMIEDPERVVEHASVLEEKHPWRDDEYAARFELRERLHRAGQLAYYRARELEAAKWGMGLAGVTILSSVYLLANVTNVVTVPLLLAVSIPAILLLTFATLLALAFLAYRVLIDF